MKKIIIISIIFLIISGCSNGRKLQKYTSCQYGEKYQLEKDLLAIKYDYLRIPLVKPGFQLIDMKAEEINDVDPELKMVLVGKLKKGDIILIDSFVEEGGWIPCKGDWYMINPMAKVITGELSGQVIGISLLCDYERDKPQSYKTGHIGYMNINHECLKKVNAD